MSNICVISNAMFAKAAAPEALIIVDKALTASFDAKLNEAALDVLGAVQVKSAVNGKKNLLLRLHCYSLCTIQTRFYYK